MKMRHAKEKNVEEIADLGHKGLDVSKYFTGEPTAKQRVNVDFTLPALKMIDAECSRLGITRQAWIKMVCDEKIQEVLSNFQRFSIAR